MTYRTVLLFSPAQTSVVPSGIPPVWSEGKNKISKEMFYFLLK